MNKQEFHPIRFNSLH